MKVIFRTVYNRQENDHYYTPVGEEYEMRHTAHIDKNGRRFLERDKKVETYALIQSHREECEIENIIRRSIEGDYNALNAVNGVYADITNCPSSIAEAQQYIINAKNEFDKLPKDIKAKFEYNPEIYIAEMGGNTTGWLDKMGYTEARKAEEARISEEKRQKDLANKAIENLANIASGDQIKGGNVDE